MLQVELSDIPVLLAICDICHTGFDTACLFFNTAIPSGHYGLPVGLFHPIFRR